jgi:hypothetical protein
MYSTMFVVCPFDDEETNGSVCKRTKRTCTFMQNFKTFHNYLRKCTVFKRKNIVIFASDSNVLDDYY